MELTLTSPWRTRNLIKMTQPILKNTGGTGNVIKKQNWHWKVDERQEI